jgi:hypothetical protein
MLRPFQIPSDAISFSGGAATAAFSQRTGPKTRAAVVGMDTIAADYRNGLLTLINSLKIAGRQYIQGDGSGFPIGLLTPGAYPDPDATNDRQQQAGEPYFPGSAIPHPDGRITGGLLLQGAEIVEIGLASVASGSNEISQIVLHCLEFPQDYWPDMRRQPETPEERRMYELQAAVDELWRRFRSGEGELLFDGRTTTQATATAASVTLESQIKMQHDAQPRRLEVRGMLTTPTAVDESSYRAGTLIIGGETTGPNQKSAAPARSVTGHAHRRVPGVMVDFNTQDTSTIQLAAPTQSSGVTHSWRFLTIFQGRAPEDVILCSPRM